MSWLAAALLTLSLAVGPLAGQRVLPRQSLDSGTVVRLTCDSTTVVYCRYPAPACGEHAGSPAEVRSVKQLVRAEDQHGSRAGRGALIGAAVGGAVLGLGRLAFADRYSPAPWTGQRVAAAVTFVGLAAGIGALVGRGWARWVAAP